VAVGLNDGVAVGLIDGSTEGQVVEGTVLRKDKTS
jgi:hypothetical protein